MEHSAGNIVTSESQLTNIPGWQQIVKKQRPVNLQLNTIKFPPSAIVSILHRITGVAMFFALLLVILAWAGSLQSKEGFEMVSGILGGVVGKLLVIGTVSALTYHILGGVRHMFMDLGYFEELESGNGSAKAIIGLWVVLTIVMGALIW